MKINYFFETLLLMVLMVEILKKERHKSPPLTPAEAVSEVVVYDFFLMHSLINH